MTSMILADGTMGQMMEPVEFKEITELGAKLYLSVNGEFAGVIVLNDTVRDTAYGSIMELYDAGVQNTVMLTGDNKATASAIASQAGITHVVSDVLPADKAGVVENLRGQGHKVLMVGDGINDAPALACADVAMAIGAGTDIAIETADVVLTGGSLMGVADAIGISKATMRNIKQNLFWAFFYNSIGIPLAAGVFIRVFGWQLNPMFAAAAMSLSSVSVVVNALRLNFFQMYKKSKNRKDTKCTVESSV